MEVTSENNLVSNHLISDVTEDVVLLDSAATISADLTEVTDEDQKIDLRHAKHKDEDFSENEDLGVASSISGFYTKGESQNDRNRKHEVLPGGIGDKKCKFSG